MVDLTEAIKLMQIEAVDRDSGVSEGMLRDIGANINALIIRTKSNGSIGDISFSALSEAQFQSERDVTWILSDGRDITGSDYHTLTGKAAAPDMRGEFARGLDNGRGIDTGRVIASSQLSRNTAHVHSVNDSGHSHGASARAAGDEFDPLGSGAQISSNYAGGVLVNVAVASTGITLGSDGGTDGRPRNVAGNYFIKINRNT